MADKIRQAAERIIKLLSDRMETDRFCIRATEIEQILRDVLRPQRVWAVHLADLDITKDLWQHGEYWGSKEAAESYASVVFPRGGAKISAFDVMEVDE